MSKLHLDAGKTNKERHQIFVSLSPMHHQPRVLVPSSLQFHMYQCKSRSGREDVTKQGHKRPFFPPSSSSFFLHFASSSHAYGKGEEGEMEEVLVFPIWRDSPSSSSSEMRPCFPSFPNSLCCSLLCVSPRPSTPPPPLPYMANGLRLFLLLSPQRRV